MVNDRITMQFSYDAYEIANAVIFRDKNFQHPWFFDTDEHRLMTDFSEEHIFIRSLKTGIIFEFRLDEFPTFNRRSMLLTSTNRDTFQFRVAGGCSLRKTMKFIERISKPRPSRTASNGIITTGAYIRKQYDHLRQTLASCEMVLTDESLELLYKDLLRRRDKYAGK